MLNRSIGHLFVLSVVFGFGIIDAPAEEPNPSGCLECHSPSNNGTPRLDGPPQLADSVHARLDCTDCHQSISMEKLERESPSPHGGKSSPVNCGECHEDALETYAKHGRLEVGKDPDLPSCWSCHGAHNILTASDRRSKVHPTNLPDTCRSCHTNVDLVKKHFILRDKSIKNYEGSVHGRATKKGLYVAAGCDDCHSATDKNGKRTAHRILSPADPQSTIYHFNIPDTCGTCHKYVTQDYWEGIHGQYVKNGSLDAPVCTTCHGEHGIISPREPLSPVSPRAVATDTCSPCHESALFNEKYGLPGGRLASYIDSYHGLKSKAGDVMVANCSSCHGAHRILPSSDPTSSIHANNLLATCGDCHPGISPDLAGTKIHQSSGLHTGWSAFFRELYIVLIIVTIGIMVLHNGADWLRHVRRMTKTAFVQRLSANEVVQHWVLALSFTALVVSGFALRFSDAFWVKWLFGWEGGFEARGIIHRVSAIVMMLGAVWHIVYLFTARGRHWFRDMVASRKDLSHIAQNLAYFAGRREEPPRFERFSYMEKIEYWALFWGTIIMSGTGVLLWFDNYFSDRWGLPKGFLDVMLVIHYYEAWLAFLAIVVWHLYGTLFKPSVYPMNPSWLTGKMPRDMYLEEHPDGPKLKARSMRIRYEDEEEPGGGESSARIASDPKSSDVSD